MLLPILMSYRSVLLHMLLKLSETFFQFQLLTLNPGTYNLTNLTATYRRTRSGKVHRQATI